MSEELWIIAVMFSLWSLLLGFNYWERSEDEARSTRPNRALVRKRARVSLLFLTTAPLAIIVLPALGLAAACRGLWWLIRKAFL